MQLDKEAKIELVDNGATEAFINDDEMELTLTFEIETEFDIERLLDMEPAIIEYAVKD
jgi:hypothetical protein